MLVKELTINAPRAAAGKKFTVSSGSADTSAALSAGTYVIVADTPICVAVGSNPTATTSYPMIPANQAWRIAGVQDQEKVSVIGATGSGSAWLWKD